MGLNVRAQDFQLSEGMNEVEVPVELVSNLMIVRAEVNGTSMRFILDSGASRSTIFNIHGVDSLTIGTGVETIVKGYGSLEPFQALYSQNNLIDIQGFTAIDANIYVLTKEQISFVSLLGQEVNGILGVDFFKNHLVELDYEQERLTVAAITNQRIKRKYSDSLSLDTSNGKPYLTGFALNQDSEQEMSLLFDTGSGDALWFFQKNDNFKIPKKGFRDYLGLGLSGDVFGFRSKIDALTIADFKFNKVTVAFPELETEQKQSDNNILKGSIGGEVLRRFKVLVDYPNGQIHFSANRSFNDGFYFNMAGLKLREGSKELVTRMEYTYNAKNKRESRSLTTITSKSDKALTYTYVPQILVSYIVQGSPADKAGIKEGDQIVGFDGKEIGKFNMGEITQLFYKKPYNTIDLNLKRDDKYYSVSLKLIPIIDDE
jgi:hypothetical protein